MERKIIPISAEEKQGLEELKEIIVERIELMRIYLRKPGMKEADMDEPIIVKNDILRNLFFCRKT